VARPGTRTPALVETVDLYPTLCELAGLPAPKNPQPMEGKSLVPVLKKPSSDNKEAVFHVYPRNRKGDGAILGRAVRTARYRLVEWKKSGAAPDTAEFELYDYESDPAETRNLASAQPAIVKALQALIAAQPEARRQR
jgi:iduronate 2-sulfatase